MSGSQVWRVARPIVLVALLGVLAGLAWYVLAPTPAFVVRAAGVGYVKDLPGEYVAMDGWFAVCGLVAGVLCAVAVIRRRGAHGITPRVLVAASLLGVLGSLVAWQVGRFLGPAESGPAGARVVSTVFHGGLDLTAKGVLLVWPVVTLAVLTFAIAWASREPSAELPGPESVRGDGDLAGLDRG